MAFLLSCQREWDNPWDDNTRLGDDGWAPQSFQISDSTLTSRLLEWTADFDRLDGFQIDRKAGAEEWVSPFAVLPPTSREWRDTTIIPIDDQIYTYRICATLPGKASAYLEVNSKIYFCPQNINCSINGSVAVLSWDKPVYQIDSVVIDRNLGNSEWVMNYKILPPDVLELEDDLYRNIGVEYRFTACNDGLKSIPAIIKSSRVLRAPQYLMTRRFNANVLRLDWKDKSVGEDCFVLERKITGESNWDELCRTKEEFFEDTLFPLDTVIDYRVCAVLGEERSDYDELNVSSKIYEVEYFSIDYSGGDSADLSWKHLWTDIDGFRIDRRKNNERWLEKYYFAAKDESSFHDSCLDISTPNTYYYRIRAYLGDYSSPWIEEDISVWTSKE